MLFLKILFQIGTGISSLIAILLDYKWHDKRKIIFKKFRNIAIFLAVALLIIGVFLIVQDESQKNFEITSLNSQLDSVQSRLNSIQKSGDSLNFKITPFLKLATERYPNVSSEQALDSLKRDIFNLGTKTNKLEVFENNRQTNEKEFAKLKSTPPSIGVSLIMDKKRTVSVGIQFLNRVPIKFTYRLQNYSSNKSYSDGTRGDFELYPQEDGKIIYFKDDFNFKDNLRNEETKLKITVYYESLYYLQNMSSALRGSKSAIYTVNPFNNTISLDN
jgi:hypothetical protein